MSHRKAKNKLKENPEKIYSIEEIKSVLQNKQMVSPYVYKHIIFQFLDEETKTFMLSKFKDKFDFKPEDYVTC